MEKRSLRQICAAIVEEVRTVLAGIEESECDQFLRRILSARRVFVAGQGRSGVVARAFAARLVQLGFSVHVVGETTAPAAGAGDLLIACSGSGETAITCHIADVAKKSGAAVCTLTARQDSRLAQAADVMVIVPGLSKGDARGSLSSIQLAGTSFEQSLLLLFDAMVVWLQEELAVSAADMMARHANLE